MNSARKGFGLIGLIIAVAVIAALTGGGLYFREGQQRKSQIQMGLEAEKKAKELRDRIMNQQRQQLEAAGENPATPQPSPIDISTWKTYRNEKYGFELQMPATFNVQPDFRGSSIDSFSISGKTGLSGVPDTMIIFLTNAPPRIPLMYDRFENIAGLQAGVMEKTSISGYSMEISFSAVPENITQGKSHNIAYIQINTSPTYGKQVFKNILATFKFIK